MAQKTKKAKLAHEKRTGGQVDLGRAFMAYEIVEMIDFQGKPSAVVVMDEAGTKGIIDAGYVTIDANGANVMRKFANPVTYDTVAQAKALEKFAAYSQN